MLITAGYLSYGSNYNNQAMGTTSKPEENPNIASLGDAELVNTNITEENKNKETTTPVPEQEKPTTSPEQPQTKAQENRTKTRKTSKCKPNK